MRAAERRSRRRVGGGGSLPQAPTGGSTGLGDFEHDPYTVEGGIERIGAFAAGAKRATGWKGRLAMLLLLAIFVLPLLIGALVNLLS